MREKIISKGTDNWVVEDVSPHEDYTLIIRFRDGSHRLYDAKGLLDIPFMSKLRNKNFFMNAHVKYGTVAWDDEIDIDPEFLYQKGHVIEQTNAYKN